MKPKSISLVLFFLFIFLMPTLGFSSVSIQDYGALSVVSRMAVSPDGKMIVFRKRTESSDNAVIYSLSKRKVLSAIDLTDIKPRAIYFIDQNRIVIRVSEEKYLRGFKDPSLNISSAYVYDIKKIKFSSC